jgi:hypothetical protein
VLRGVLFEDFFPFETGICHLRVYCGSQEELVVLAVEPDDNPGRSIVNAAEALIERIETVFGDEFCLFLHFPSSPGKAPVWTEVSIDTEEERANFDRREIPHAEIEQLVGEQVSLPKTDAASAADIGGKSHPLLALIPPEEEEWMIIDEMQVVAVADLPWPHNPSECAHAERFESIRRLYDERFDGHIPAGAHFFLSLNREAFSICRYHQHDWQAIAAASVELLEALGPTSDFDEVVDRATALIDEKADREQLISLFSDPIKWAPGETSITNGQHRTCALKATGAELCVAQTYGELRTKPVSTDPYRRAQSALAEYWARQLGQDPPPSSHRNARS